MNKSTITRKSTVARRFNALFLLLFLALVSSVSVHANDTTIADSTIDATTIEKDDSADTEIEIPAETPLNTEEASDDSLYVED